MDNKGNTWDAIIDGYQTLGCFADAVRCASRKNLYQVMHALIARREQATSDYLKRMADATSIEEMCAIDAQYDAERAHLNVLLEKLRSRLLN